MVHITLCMIVRDEEAELARCLSSVAPAVEDICIVDTGSRDGTVDLAQRFGARVEREAWCDDFSAVRNRCLAMAQGDWILTLDADERLVELDARSRLELFTQRNAQAAGHIWVENRRADDGEHEISRSRTARFFPRATSPTYEGSVIEELLFGGTSPTGLDTGLTIRHVGYASESDRRRAKLETKKGMLESALSVRAEDPRLWFEYGRISTLQNRPVPALAAYREALARVPEDAVYRAHLAESAALCLRNLGRPLEARKLLEEITRDLPGRSEAHYLAAVLDTDLGRLELAETGFHHCLELSGARAVGSGSAPSTRGAAAAWRLGRLTELRGDVDSALTWYRAAQGYQPGHGPSLEGQVRLESYCAGA